MSIPAGVALFGAVVPVPSRIPTATGYVCAAALAIAVTVPPELYAPGAAPTGTVNVVVEPTAEITHVPLTPVAPTTDAIVTLSPTPRPCAPDVVTTADAAFVTPVMVTVSVVIIG